MKRLIKLSSGVGLLSILLLMAACAHSGVQSEREATPEERLEILLDAASSTLREGDPTGALMYAVEAEKIAQDRPNIYYIKGVAFLQKRDLNRAYQEMKKALALKSDFSSAHNALGKICVDLGRYAEAEKSLLIAARDPLNREAFLAKTNLGILYYKQEKWNLSEVQMRSAIQDAPKVSCVAQFYLGHLQLRKNEKKSAIESYRKATLGSCGGFTDAHYALGVAYARDKQYEKARKKFLEVKEMFPESSFASKAMAELRFLP